MLPRQNGLAIALRKLNRIERALGLISSDTAPGGLYLDNSGCRAVEYLPRAVNILRGYGRSVHYRLLQYLSPLG